MVEHSVHVACEIDPALAMVDAAEAYLGDVPSLLKAQLSQFSAFERKMEQVIGEKYGIDPELFKCAELKRADVQLLVDEKVVLMVVEPETWPPSAPEAKDRGRIEGWGSIEAKGRFLEEFKKLG